MFKYLVMKYGYNVKILKHIKNVAINEATWLDVNFNGDIELVKKFMEPYRCNRDYKKLLKNLDQLHYYHNYTAGDVSDFVDNCYQIVMRVN